MINAASAREMIPEMDQVVCIMPFALGNSYAEPAQGNRAKEFVTKD
jgi:hypothetical protein